MGPADVRRLTVEGSEDRLRVDRFIAARLPEMSRALVQKLAREGHVLVQDRPARPSRIVRSGEVVTIRIPPPEPTTLVPEIIPLRVLHEDEDLLVIDKPAGMVVHPGSGARHGTLVHALLARGPMWSTIGGAERPGIVHRLDRGTSGVMVVARNDAAHRSLAAQFKNREVEKVYLAIVWGVPRNDRFSVEAPLGRDTVSRLRISTRTTRPRPASTEFRLSRKLGGFALLEARPRTGRTHQIRAHLLHAGHPIVGDAVYGGARWKNLPAGALRERIRSLGRLGLHAHRLAFTHPATGRRLAFEAPLPEDLSRLLEEMQRR